MSEVYNCWPHKWLMAAVEAGFAYKKDDRFIFENDALRKRLETFAESIVNDA